MNRYLSRNCILDTSGSLVTEGMFDKLCYSACDSSKTRLGRKWRGSRSNAPIYHTFYSPNPKQYNRTLALRGWTTKGCRTRRPTRTVSIFTTLNNQPSLACFRRKTIARRKRNPKNNRFAPLAIQFIPLKNKHPQQNQPVLPPFAL